MKNIILIMLFSFSIQEVFCQSQKQSGYKFYTDSVCLNVKSKLLFSGHRKKATSINKWQRMSLDTLSPFCLTIEPKAFSLLIASYKYEEALKGMRIHF